MVLALVTLAVPAVQVAASPGGTNWAVVFAGGGDYDNNHGRYWNNISEMYEILLNYGYTAGNIFVLYADGNPPSATNCHDMAHVIGTYPTDIIDYDATPASLQEVCEYIADHGDCEDTLFVYLTDHGGRDASDSYLTTWWGGGSDISSTAFAGPSYFGQITEYRWRAFELVQCFAGHFAQALSGPRTVIATGCGDESCWSTDWFSIFGVNFNAALKGSYPIGFGGAVNADTSGDGKVSMLEAWNYAQPFGGGSGTPHYDDNGDGSFQTGAPLPAGGDGDLGSVVILGETHNPIADAGPDQTVEQAYYQGADVTLDGSGSSDPDGDAITYAWTWSGGSASGVSPTVSLPLGTTVITLVVNDGFLDSCPDTVSINVVDTTPPSVDAGPDITVEQETVAGTEVTLWASVSDICDPSPVVVWSHGPTYVFPLGDTTVTVTAIDASGNVGSDTVVVHVVDTTPPELECVEATNPHGEKTPAGKGKGSGRNPDGFYQLFTEDICDPNPVIYIGTESDPYLFGPFESGIIVKITEAPGAVPECKPIGSAKGEANSVAYHVTLPADPYVTVVDFSGNEQSCTDCLVPRKPK
jgi:hypothetical protein